MIDGRLLFGLASVVFVRGMSGWLPERYCGYLHKIGLFGVVEACTL
jgi:hypothetical protein